MENVSEASGLGFSERTTEFNFTKLFFYSSISSNFTSIAQIVKFLEGHVDIGKYQKEC